MWRRGGPPLDRETVDGVIGKLMDLDAKLACDERRRARLRRLSFGLLGRP